MSDQPRGEDWWEASDDKWHPPEKHPDYRDPRPPPPSEPAPERRGRTSGWASDPSPAPESAAFRIPGWDSAEWIVDALEDEAIVSGKSLEPGEWLSLTMDLNVYMGLPVDAIGLNNKVVTLARNAMERAKRQGAPTVKPRPGLTVPSDWFYHYNVLYDEECPLLIASIMQNAMLNNPIAGERKAWKSNDKWYPPESHPDYRPPAPTPPSGVQRHAETDGTAVASLVLGILSWIVLPVLGAIAAIVFGHVARGRIRRSNGRVTGNGLATAGLVLGYVQMILIVAVVALVGLTALVLSPSTNEEEPADATRRDEAASLLAALNQTEPLTVGFSATHALTIEGESSTTNITGAGRFVGPDDADLTAMVEPESDVPIEVTLVRTEGKRFLSIDGPIFQGGDESVLPGVTGSLLDGLRAIIEMDTLASELELRGGGGDQLLEALVTDVNAGIDDPPPLTTTFQVELDANDQPVAANVSAIGGDPEDIQIEITLNMVFGPSSDSSDITLPATATDGLGSAQRFPVIAEALREPYGYPP